ncbi:MAG: phosphodiester glycosidase family protein [Bacteroidia bacterium]
MKWIFIFLLPSLLIQPQARKQWVNPNPEALKWQSLEQGLDLAIADATIKCNIGDSKIRVLRIDPTHFDFRLLSTKELKHQNLTADQWSQKYQLTALVNAGMYQMDHQTNVGYMRNYQFVNNGRVSKDNTLIAFNPKDQKLAPFQIIDRTCQDWENVMTQYQSVTQGIRMVDCEQKNRWGQQPKYWSMVAIAVDKQGRVLFLHSRTPYSVRDFIKQIMALPLDIYNAMYLEGGPEASFFLDHPKTKVKAIGSYETGFYESDSNDRYWPIPNVIGIVRKE